MYRLNILENFFPDRFKNWTEKTNNKGKITIGAFQSSYAGHYCETQLFNFRIGNRRIKTNSPEFKAHIAKKSISF